MTPLRTLAHAYRSACAARDRAWATMGETEGDERLAWQEKHIEASESAWVAGVELLSAVETSSGAAVAEVGAIPTWLTHCLLDHQERPAGSGPWTVVEKKVTPVDRDSRLMVLVCERGWARREAVVSGVTWESAVVGGEVELEER